MIPEARLDRLERMAMLLVRAGYRSMVDVMISYFRLGHAPAPECLEKRFLTPFLPDSVDA
jgi:hypothetical protein